MYFNNFVSMETVRDDEPRVVSFSSTASCSEQDLEDTYKSLITKILTNRDVVIITKQDKLIDLISDSVPESEQAIIKNNLIELPSFTVEYNDAIKHNCTLVRNLLKSVAEDLAISSEFLYGNLWFLIPSGKDSNCLYLKEDISKLSPSGFSTLPLLQNEVLAAPAMYDGLKILWFKPDKEIYESIICPLFDLERDSETKSIIASK